uniref:Photosystem II extrinsic protein V n=1 Tax=Ophidocladus simpliciusculus TaxID=1261574 RepID=A0A1Z1MIK6_9FLOR|nr:photosystem II cytochrome c550 [Ophidocladus simpliciusculus]ARW65907.1 photosystem II cytochrome c550 [Ophidocladus simpliciusculus]
MIKKKVSLLSLVVFFLSLVIVAFSATSVELDETTRTVIFDSSGKSITLTPEQVRRGKRLFNNSCAQCHNGGITKTNPNIGLEQESLSKAIPPRDNIINLVDYMKEPTSYDGQTSIADLHPSIKSAEIFPKMRNFTDEDLLSVAGYILLQPQVSPEKWGGGKIYY